MIKDPAPATAYVTRKPGAFYRDFVRT